MVTAADLRFAYPDGREALRAVSFSIAPGERVALLGPNGAGKSTLLKCIVGLLRPQGRLEVLGLPVMPPNYRRIRRRVGFLFQDPDQQILLPRVYEDVAFTPTQYGLEDKEVERLVAHALEQTGLAGYEDRYTYRLSLGEKKRVALAGILAAQPELYLLDEPTAGLDPAARDMLLRHLSTIPSAMLVATHDLDAASRLCTRALVMDSGQIVRDCPTEALAGSTYYGQTECQAYGKSRFTAV
ncbi:MAG: energy-coupling factor ABC transporter ATP-binding protein [Armatimonadota bacterium]